VKRWVDDLLPLLTERDVLGVDTFASRHLPLGEAPQAYDMFQKKSDRAFKVVFEPGS
jgi:threonine dehydrogenase-like Zn-dependent dehydrogenase